MSRRAARQVRHLRERHASRRRRPRPCARPGSGRRRGRAARPRPSPRRRPRCAGRRPGCAGPDTPSSTSTRGGPVAAISRSRSEFSSSGALGRTSATTPWCAAPPVSRSSASALAATGATPCARRARAAPARAHRPGPRQSRAAARPSDGARARRARRAGRRPARRSLVPGRRPAAAAPRVVVSPVLATCSKSILRSAESTRTRRTRSSSPIEKRCFVRSPTSVRSRSWKWK